MMGGQAKAINLTESSPIIAPDDLDSALAHWLRLPRIPLLESKDDKTRWLLAAMLNRISGEIPARTVGAE